MSLGPDARSLIETASGGDDPSEADAARVRRKLASRVTTAAAAGAATVAGAKTASAGLGMSAKIGLVVALAIGAGVPLGLAFVPPRSATNDRPPEKLEQRAAPRPVRSTAPTASVEPVESIEPIEKESALPRIEPPRPNAQARTVTASPAGPRPAEQPASSGAEIAAPPDSVAAEAALLREARAALARGDGAAALASLDVHAARFPHGALTEERQATRVFALCASGQGDEARTAANTFLTTSPRSPLAERVRRACAPRD